VCSNTTVAAGESALPISDSHARLHAGSQPGWTAKRLSVEQLHETYLSHHPWVPGNGQGL